MTAAITHCECPWCGCLMEIQIEGGNLACLVGEHPVKCWLHGREVQIDYSYVLTWNDWRDRLFEPSPEIKGKA